MIILLILEIIFVHTFNLFLLSAEIFRSVWFLPHDLCFRFTSSGEEFLFSSIKIIIINIINRIMMVSVLYQTITISSSVSMEVQLEAAMAMKCKRLHFLSLGI